ncbi:hypothetical protein H106_06618 [Trichophyton rubrum CBS 735.88]|nr:hypothetical protein H106_06618 [Trichophyton rubrum CBS 735.88]
MSLGSFWCMQSHIRSRACYGDSTKWAKQGISRSWPEDSVPGAITTGWFER